MTHVQIGCNCLRYEGSYYIYISYYLGKEGGQGRYHRYVP